MLLLVNTVVHVVVRMVPKSTPQQLCKIYFLFLLWISFWLTKGMKLKMIKKSFFSDKPSPYQGQLFHLRIFPDSLHLHQGKTNDLIYSLTQSVTILGELVPVETFQGELVPRETFPQTSCFLAIWLEVKKHRVGFQHRKKLNNSSFFDWYFLLLSFHIWCNVMSNICNENFHHYFSCIATDNLLLPSC